MTYYHYPLDYKPEDSTRSEGCLEYAEVYKNAIKILLKEYTSHRPLHDYCLAPVLCLLRQYIELQLKGIILYNECDAHKTIEGHNIVKLYEMAQKKTGNSYECPKPNDDVTKFIDSLGRFDPKGQAFRYPETLKGEDFLSGTDPWLRKKIMSIPDLNDVGSTPSD